MNQPEPQSLPYEVLLGDIAKGLVKIPQFQRDFVWSRDKSAALIDSILRGYPIGTFILWRTKETLRSVRNIGNAKLPSAPEGEYVNQVLDGQQRLTSLFATLRGLKIRHDDQHETEDFGNIYIDLAAKDGDPFTRVLDDGGDKSSTIRVVDLVSQGLKFLTKYPEKYHEQIERFQQRLKSYLFSVVLVKDVPIDVAAEIFTRINEGGKPLTPFEIMVAKTYLEGKFDLAEACDDLIEELREVEFETLPEMTILQVAAVLLRGDCRKKAILGLPRNEFIAAWPKVVEAVKHAVDYLRITFRIPASRLLPYPAMIIPLAYWFHRAKGAKPKGVDADQLRSLFWRIAVESRYSASLESEVAQDIRRVDEIRDGKSPKYDAPLENISWETIRDQGNFGVGRAFIRGILCMLAARAPESFDDGSKVVLDNDWLIQVNSKNYHHFFPRAFLKKQGVDDWMANHIANITIIDDRLNKREIRDKPPSKYIKQFKSNKKLDKTLGTHLIDLDDSGIFEDDYDIFFEKRCRRIATEMRKLISIDR
jgi:hypothetical protein